MKLLALFTYRYNELEMRIFYQDGYFLVDDSFDWLPYSDARDLWQFRDAVSAVDYHRLAANWMEVEL